MADQKISALTELTVPPDPTDEFVVVDKSDTSMAASGTDKRLQYSNILVDAIATSRKLKPTFGLLVASGGLTLTTSLVDVPSVTVTFSPATASTVIVVGFFDFTITGTTSTAAIICQGALDVDGATQSPLANFQFTVVGASGAPVSRAVVSQAWAVNLTAASHTLKLQAKKSLTGTGTGALGAGHSQMLYLVVSQ